MEDDDYKVGYGKPPKKSQFKKGRSGNPKGRPGKRGGEGVDVDSILNEKVLVKTREGKRKIGSRDLRLRVQLRTALDGNLQAASYVIDVFEKYGVFTVPRQQQDHGVVVLPTNTIPDRVCSVAVRMYGRPPWSDKQLQPVIEDYLETRTESERVEDERMGYEL